MLAPTWQSEPARILKVDFEIGDNMVSIPYHIDDVFAGQMLIRFPLPLSKESYFYSPLALAASVFLAQFCLARNIICRFSCSEEMVQAIRPIAELLYDVRCYKDGRPLLPPPRFAFRTRVLPGVHEIPAGKRATHLWSGGVDSTLSLLVLQRNGFTAVPVHVIANAHTKVQELQAVHQLSRSLFVDFLKVELVFPQQLDMGRYYSTAFDIYPYENGIPFGRELLLVLIAGALAVGLETPFITLGGDYDGRYRQFPYLGKIIYRNEMESAYACSLLEQFLRRFVSPSLRLFPPLGNWSKYRILRTMFTEYPELAGKTSFCFWERPCGMCFKCVLYWVVQRQLGCEILKFDGNPARDNSRELRAYITMWNDRRLMCHSAMHYSLSSIARERNTQPGELLLERYRQEVYPHFKGALKRLGQEMLRLKDDPLLPMSLDTPT